MIIDNFTVLKNTEISKNTFDCVLARNNESFSMPEIKAGQFINIYPKSSDLTLPRPISVCDFDGEKLRVVYEVVGKGTKEFAGYKTGESAKVMLPLGNGFSIENTSERHTLIGGSLGAAPLLFLAKQLKGKVDVFLGFRDEPVLSEEFKSFSDNVYIATETGNYGEQGTVIDALNRHDNGGGMYYACGPLPMLRALSGYLDKKDAKGQFSLDARMACGFGVCVGCAVKIKNGDEWQYLKTCVNGPVFDYKEILWD